MQKFMRVCPICAKENIRKESHSKIYVAGWNAGFLEEPDNEETSFMQAMNDLKERDIIEYNLKLSQFKTQVEQQQSNKLQNDNTPKCPTCNSTNIKKISGLSKAGSVAMWGLLSRKVHKQWHCNQCGSEW